MSDFLPDGYTPPAAEGNYFKFQLGENRFRPLSSPIMGYVWWVNAEGQPRQKGEKPGKGDKPVRVPMSGKVPAEAADTFKHFWAMIVYNTQDNRIQILEITQKTVQAAIKNIVSDEDWGNPVGDKGYDFVVTRSGEGLETEYTVLPKKPSPLPEGVMDKLKEMAINLDALYQGEDPFLKQVDEEVDPEDIPF